MKAVGLRMGTVAYDQVRGEHVEEEEEEEENALSLLFRVKKVERS